jgi:Zn-dependent protease with chaperone function
MRTATRLLAPFAAVILFANALDAASFREHLDEGQASTQRRPYSADRAERQMARVRAVMLPLVRVTNHRMSADQIQVSIVDDRAINAATAGAGRYFVTTGLLNRATDDQLRGVLAHEIAHEDLGHPVKPKSSAPG